MTAEEWESIKALFDAALQQPPAQRLPWLQTACAARPDLFQTVRQLIQDYEESSWLDPRSNELGPVFAAGDIVAGRFLIRRLLAHGGMGEVYEAVDNSLRGVKIALKTIRRGLASEQQALERFKREVWVAREMAHPGICRVFDLVEHKVFRPDGTETTIPCLTMSLLDGESLAAHVSRRGPLSVERALPIVRQLAECVQAMHDNNIVHRDIKPSNIMLVPASGDGLQVILIDFGLAKPVNSQAEAWETKTQQQAGAPYFVSPEALRGEPVGRSSDLYALGLVIDDMVTVRPAYRYGSMEELFWRKLHDKPEAPSARSIGLPLAWERAILQCLERDPAKRPRSATEFVQALECGGERKLSETVLRALYQVRHYRFLGPPFEVSSRRKWISGVCLGAIAAAGIGAYEGQRGDLASSILVLPFENLASQREPYQALCVGATEELVRRLGYVKGLNVLEAPPDWNPDAPALKGIRFLLQGTLQDSHGTPELAVRLTDNLTGSIVWTDAFSQNLQQPLKLESALTNRTIDEIRRHLEPAGSFGGILSRFLPAPSFWRAELPAPATKSNTAALEYQRGRALWQQRSLAGALEAVKAYQAAIQDDARFALAYAALADVQHTLLTYSYGSTNQLMTQAVEYAEQAVSIDASLPECHVARGAAKQNLWAWKDSETSYRLAIEKQPRFARAHHWYAGLLLQFGAFDAALARARVGLDMAPFDFPAQSNHGLYLWYAGRPKEAMRQLESVTRKTNLLFAHVILGEVCAHLAAQEPEPNATIYFNKSMEHAGAVLVQELSGVKEPEPPFLKWSDLLFVQAYAARGDSASAANYMRRMERGFAAGKVPGTLLAWAYAALKQWKKTLEMLQYGADQQEREMLYVKVYPLFRTLSGHPSYVSLLKRMRLA